MVGAAPSVGAVPLVGAERDGAASPRGAVSASCPPAHEGRPRRGGLRVRAWSAVRSRRRPEVPA
jgi:hypothetical protein